MTFIKGSKEHHFEGLKIDLNAAEISAKTVNIEQIYVNERSNIQC